MFSNQLQLSWIVDLFRLGARLIENDLTQVRTQILEHTVSGFGASSGTLALTNEDKASLTIVAGIHLPTHILGHIVPFDQGVMGWVAQHGKSVLQNGDISKDPRFTRLGGAREGARQRPLSAICWPLLIKGQVIGVMSLNRSATEQPFTEQDIDEGTPIISLMTLIIENTRLQIDRQEQIAELGRLNTELKDINKRFEDAQSQLLQSEKMASIGLLAAGVAHEINNPVGYVHSNLGSLQKYTEDLFRVLHAYEAAEQLVEDNRISFENIHSIKKQVGTEFLETDIAELIKESLGGVRRVRDIVQNLKDFSHVDEAEWQVVDLHKGLDSTLKIAHNEIKYKATVIKEYSDIPPVECLASQLNQVFMNLLVNAAQAIETQGIITVRTGIKDDWVWIEVSDNGKGIPQENINRIFEPFFTTKPVGKGTGLGLSLSYGIIKKHGGRCEVHSEAGQGTTFKVWLPVSQGNSHGHTGQRKSAA